MTAAATSLGDLIPGILERSQSPRVDNQTIRSPTGLQQLDDLTGGFRNGELIVIGARPSMGKTTFTCHIALHAAANLGIPVAYFSMDLGGAQLALRLIARGARVNPQSLMRGTLDSDESERVESTSERLAQAPLYIDDDASSISDLSERCRCAATEQGLGLVIVDYLQAYRSGENDLGSPRAEPSTALKHLAMELGLPIVATSQLNRRVEHRTHRYPRLSDLRGSSSIEDDADMVLFLYREELYWPHTPREGTADITIAKHRKGPTGTVWMKFQPAIGLFEEL